MFTPRKQGAGEASSPGLYGIFKSGLSKVRQDASKVFAVKS